MKVSVLMAAYNSTPELLRLSVLSVINQTFKDFEFIIVDDGSKSPIEPYVRQISNDERIVVYRKENSGLGSSLTYGISKAKGEYIARIDDDDLMTPNRLELQVKYLDEHLDVCCVGGHMFFYNKDRYLPYRRFPLGHERIVKSMLSRKWAMAHSALMYRKESVVKAGCYRLKGTSEDLDLILQLSLVGKLANLDDYLLYYHLSVSSLSSTNSQLPGHAFALREYKKSDDYAKNLDLVNRSLEQIELEMRENKKRINWKRYGMIKCIGLFGKKLPND